MIPMSLLKDCLSALLPYGGYLIIYKRKNDEGKVGFFALDGDDSKETLDYAMEMAKDKLGETFGDDYAILTLYFDKNTIVDVACRMAKTAAESLDIEFKDIKDMTQDERKCMTYTILDLTKE